MRLPHLLACRSSRSPYPFIPDPRSVGGGQWQLLQCSSGGSVACAVAAAPGVAAPFMISNSHAIMLQCTHCISVRLCLLPLPLCIAAQASGAAQDDLDATQPQFASIVKRVPRRLLLQQGCVTASELPPALPHATGGGGIASNDCCISFTNQAPRALACHYMILTINGKTGEGSNG